MFSGRRACRNKTIVPNRNPVIMFIKRVYHTYFGMKCVGQDKACAPHMVYTTCTDFFYVVGPMGRKVVWSFGIPMVCREPANHGTDYYFCVIDDDTPHLFSQMLLNDLVRDLVLSKSSAELLTSRLKENNSLSNSACITFYRNRHESTSVFLYEEKDLVYCTDSTASGVPQYQPEDWRMFIDRRKRSLKCVLLHNGNRFASVPLAHSTTLKEKYDAAKYVREKISYDQHEWDICVDLKMVNFPFGQQAGFTNTRTLFACGIVGTELKITCFIKQFTKALGKNGGCFTYL